MIEIKVDGHTLYQVENKPQVTEEMITRFLQWKLPQDFYPDCWVSFDREKAQEYQWPTGTNLLHAGQVREMLEFVLTGKTP